MWLTDTLRQFIGGFKKERSFLHLNGTHMIFVAKPIKKMAVFLLSFAVLMNSIRSI